MPGRSVRGCLSAYRICRGEGEPDADVPGEQQDLQLFAGLVISVRRVHARLIGRRVFCRAHQAARQHRAVSSSFRLQVTLLGAIWPRVAA